MPYEIRGQCIYKKKGGEKVGCTEGDVHKYLAALEANVKDGMINNARFHLEGKRIRDGFETKRSLEIELENARERIVEIKRTGRVTPEDEREITELRVYVKQLEKEITGWTGDALQESKMASLRKRLQQAQELAKKAERSKKKEDFMVASDEFGRIYYDMLALDYTSKQYDEIAIPAKEGMQHYAARGVLDQARPGVQWHLEKTKDGNVLPQVAREGDKVRATSSILGLIEGEIYTVERVEKDKTVFGLFISYKLRHVKGGNLLTVTNGYDVLKKV